jgi:hypothetical protein
VLSSTFGKLLFGAAFLLSACQAIPAKPFYGPGSKSLRTTVTVNVVWMPSFKAVHAVCALLIGHEPKNGYVGCFDPKTQTLYAVEPRDFNDSNALEILGHEFWHALGADHPEK